ncbi:hypothetical protein C1929_15165 [Stenotrophomonas sp. ZAC14D1_NAIMI4_6]|uniref:hypothetical protein n=1 Tax=Stenotrophomonas TaxID=40323 RepID=UPI0009A1ED67|nr:MULTISPECIES: hypothetical protein [Stenotrophomonas]AWH38001.1 hypothetical protein C1929_15165 [Stenotrophomonas sp. ZAC14D1_NAIMI4_6]AWH42132.1 hypothetical protein C1927_15175 [Stenotrophomonas sp. ZAC14D1_NAIMI4_1]
MKLLQQAALAVSLALGIAATAQAATFNCAYIITDEPGSSGWHSEEADTEQNAINQTIAWIYDTFGPVGFEVKCYQQP